MDYTLTVRIWRLWINESAMDLNSAAAHLQGAPELVKLVCKFNIVQLIGVYGLWMFMIDLWGKIVQWFMDVYDRSPQFVHSSFVSPTNIGAAAPQAFSASPLQLRGADVHVGPPLAFHGENGLGGHVKVNFLDLVDAVVVHRHHLKNPAATVGTPLDWQKPAVPGPKTLNRHPNFVRKKSGLNSDVGIHRDFFGHCSHGISLGLKRPCSKRFFIGCLGWMRPSC